MTSFICFHFHLCFRIPTITFRLCCIWIWKIVAAIIFITLLSSVYYGTMYMHDSSGKTCLNMWLQILAYLLMSASSSAATRVDDWISNWGADEFTMMASASIAMSFLAFLAFALSSLISGYNLCDRNSA